MTEIPLKPFGSGKLSPKLGGSATSPLQVLERSRLVLSPRGSWRKGGRSGYSHEGATRCLIQVMEDVDGVHVKAATKYVLKAAKEITGKTYASIPQLNDDSPTQKHHIIQTLDRAIELAKEDN